MLEMQRRSMTGSASNEREIISEKACRIGKGIHLNLLKKIVVKIKINKIKEKGN